MSNLTRKQIVDHRGKTTHVWVNAVLEHGGIKAQRKKEKLWGDESRLFKEAVSKKDRTESDRKLINDFLSKMDAKYKTKNHIFREMVEHNRTTGSLIKADDEE